MPLPTEEGFYMPAEWAPHARCWMAWPCNKDLWRDGLDAARDAYADVARTIADYEPVTMVANPVDLADASLRCGSKVSCLPLPHDDSWMRDNGPTFVVDDKGTVAGVDWEFNGWGDKFKPYDRDAVLAEAILAHIKVRRFAAPFVLEGGSVHVDGEGTLLTTEQCLLNPNRNPHMTREDIEAQLAGHLGIRKVIWLGEGVEDDDTDGHVDNLTCFVKPGVVVTLTSNDKDDPNYGPLQDNLERLKAATDAKGRPLEVHEIAQPRRRVGPRGGRLPLSYVNFYIANGGVVMPSFEDPADEAAYDVIAACFPDRKVVQVPALDIVVGGGGIHCITQQQPKGGGTP